VDLNPVATIDSMPIFICPNCKDRSIDADGFEGMSRQAVACRRCGFGFLFELMEDYYPAPATGLVTCDQDGRVLAVGRGIFELTGFQERDLMGRDIVDALDLDGGPVGVVREWGVRKLGERMQIKTRSGRPQAVTVDLFPAYDTDGGLLVALTPRSVS
jgi:PAS domain-containing protein